MILNIFSSGPQHPLADGRELKKTLAELPADDPYKAVDEIVGWLDSLAHPENLRADKVCEVVRALDEAGQVHLRRLTRAYLTSSRLSKLDERRLWSLCLGFWQALDLRYEAALQAAQQKDKAADGLKSLLPLIIGRQLAAQAAVLKWTQFRYGPVAADFWSRAGKTYLLAEQGKFAAKPLQLYPHRAGATSPASEYLRLFVLAASSLDSLLPLEIELADRLIAHFIPQFIFSAQDRPDNLYWVDLAQAHAPQRLARPPGATPGLRFVSPGQVTSAIAELTRGVERGDVPEALSLGTRFSPRLVLGVLGHLASYWAPQPPLRQHQRHAVKSRLFVLHGFETSLAMLGGKADGLAEKAETWVVENVSLGGFGAVVRSQRDEWLRIGALLCLQPEGGDNWLLGVVRRYGKESETQAGVGIQTLARQAQAITLRPRRGPAYPAAGALDGLCFRDSPEADELNVVLPANTYDLRESLDAELDGRTTLLLPLSLVESGPDYELARYRIRFAG